MMMPRVSAKRPLPTTQHTSGGAVTAFTNCCANCVEPSRHPPPPEWVYILNSTINELQSVVQSSSFDK